MYPGRAVGYEGIAPSLRLKALRDSIEDCDHLAALEGLGLSAQAEPVVARLAESWFDWEASAAAYEVARAELAAMIVAPPGEPQPLNGHARGPKRVLPQHPASWPAT